MPDSVNRIVSSPIAQEGYLLRRRERGRKDEKEHEPEHSLNEGSRSSQDSQDGSRPDEQLVKSAQAKTKGKILDINV